MSTATSTSLNGRMKKTLAFQLDRLDTILDGLAEALNGAVADAVKATVGDAAKEAVKVALDEALAQTAPQVSTNPVSRAWNWLKARVIALISSVKRTALTGYQTIRRWSSRYLSTTVLAVQSGISTIKSRSLRIGLMLGALATCAVRLRQDAKVFLWSAGIVLSTILLESYLGTLGTLLLGGGALYLVTQGKLTNPLAPVVFRQAA
jgi:hypothetical protein